MEESTQASLSLQLIVLGDVFLFFFFFFSFSLSTSSLGRLVDAVDSVSSSQLESLRFNPELVHLSVM